MGRGFVNTFEWWWPEHGTRWALVFAALYVLFFFINDLISTWVSVVDDRIALVFLPAFVRVAAIVVAKLAGLVGVFMGSMVITLVHGDSFAVSLGVSLASAGGILIAYLILLQAMAMKTIAVSLPVLLLLTVLYAPLNAILHALAWDGFGMTADITAIEIAYMMLGDILGVLSLFFLLRLSTRWIKAFKGPTRA